MRAYWPRVPCKAAGLLSHGIPNNLGGRALSTLPFYRGEPECSSGKTKDLHEVTEPVSSRAGFETCLTPNSCFYHPAQPGAGCVWESSLVLWALDSELLWHHFTKFKLTELQKDQELLCGHLCWSIHILKQSYMHWMSNKYLLDEIKFYYGKIHSQIWASILKSYSQKKGSSFKCFYPIMNSIIHFIC